MKYNRAISLIFAQGTSSTTTVINLPIQVKRIHCKAVGLVNGTTPAAPEYGFIFSDLTQNTPIAMFYNDSTYPFSTGSDIEYVFANPQPIQGSYTFTLKTVNTTVPYVAPVNGTAIGLLLEFNDENEPSH
jgi:hypothetical protein